MSVRPRTVLVALVCAHVVNDFYSTILPAFLPSVAEEFDLDYTELGILSFAFIILTGVLQPVLGSFADRFGRRRWLLVFGFVVGAVGFLAMAAAPTFWFIVAVSLLGGLGGATYHPQASAFILSAFPTRPGRMLGVHGWGGSAGHFLAPAVAVLVISALKLANSAGVSSGSDDHHRDNVAGQAPRNGACPGRNVARRCYFEVARGGRDLWHY